MSSINVYSNKCDKQNDIQKIREELLHKPRRFVLIIKALKIIKSYKTDLNDRIEEKQSYLKIADYVKFFDQNSAILDKDERHHVKEFSLTESDCVLKLLVEELRKQYQPIIDFKIRICNELGTDAFPDEEFEITSQRDILELNSIYRSNLENLIKLRNRKCNLLHQVAEIKCSPLLSNELKVLLEKLSESQLKAKILQIFMVNELPTRSERTIKAIEEVQNFIANASNKP